jgi:hypothetical protein
MSVSAVRVHVLRIAQAGVARTLPSASLWRFGKTGQARRAWAPETLPPGPRRVWVAQTQPLALSLIFPRNDSWKCEDKMKKILLIPTLLLLAASAIGQTPTAPTTAPPAPAAPTMPSASASKNPISDALRDVLPGRQRNTVAAVAAMPADKFTYKPTPAQNTFGHLVVHMSEANYMLCSGATSVPAPKVEPLAESDSKDKLLTALKASFEFCTDTLAKMDDSKLGETTEGPNGQQLSRARFALGIASNWADHYGEAAMYLRLNGILPPTAKK